MSQLNTGIQDYEDDEYENEEDAGHTRKKRVWVWLAVAALIILSFFSGMFVLWRLGYLADRWMGHQVETVIISPDQADEITQDVSVRVLEQNGEPAAGYEVQMHSDVQYAVTDNAGFVYYIGIDCGMHTITVNGDNGNALASAKLCINCNDDITEGSRLYQGYTDGVYYLSVPSDTMVLEIDIVISGDELVLDEDSITALTSAGIVYTGSDAIDASEDGAVFTSHGDIMLTDDTIWLRHGGVYTPNGLYISPEGKVYRDGEQVSISELPDGYKLDLDAMTLTTPNGTVIYLTGKKVVLDDDIVIDSDGTSTYPDGTVVDALNDEIITPGGYVIDRDGNVTGPDGKPYTGSELPDGTVINGDGSITTPGGWTIRNPDRGGYYIISTDDTGDEQPAPAAETPAETEDTNLYVFDTDTGKQWNQLTTIDLFRNDSSDLIYPGASGKYSFYLKNGVDGTVSYRMTIAEAYNASGAVPLEYRLKDNTGYVAGTSAKDGWLTAEELQAVTVTLDKKGIIQYTLEWQWPYERGDTQAEIDKNDQQDMALGNAANRNHYITVSIHAEAQ